MIRTSNQHESRDFLDQEEANQERIELCELVSKLGEDSMIASEYIELDDNLEKLIEPLGNITNQIIADLKLNDETEMSCESNSELVEEIEHCYDTIGMSSGLQSLETSLRFLENEDIATVDEISCLRNLISRTRKIKVERTVLVQQSIKFYFS